MICNPVQIVRWVRSIVQSMEKSVVHVTIWMALSAEMQIVQILPTAQIVLKVTVVNVRWENFGIPQKHDVNHVKISMIIGGHRQLANIIVWEKCFTQITKYMDV